MEDEDLLKLVISLCEIVKKQGKYTNLFIGIQNFVNTGICFVGHAIACGNSTSITELSSNLGGSGRRTCGPDEP